MVDSSRVTEALVKALPRLDDDSLVEYLTAVVTDIEDYGAAGELLVEALAPFIESYECVDSVEEAEAAVLAIYHDLVSQKVMPTAEQQLTERAGGGVSAEDRDEVEDDWGLADVKVKNKANVFSDNIMSAQELRKKERKDAREQRKEEARARALVAEETAAKEAERVDHLEAQAQGQAASTAALTGEILTGPRSRDVRIEGYSLSIGAGKQLLDNADLRIVHGRKYGLIGLNGVGKTSLLREISRRRVDGFPVNLDVLHVEQEVVGDDTTVLEYVLRCDAKREMLLREEERLLALLNVEDETTDDAGGKTSVAADAKGKATALSLAALYETMTQHGTDAAEANARQILMGLSFSAEMQVATTKSLSGGWRMRVAIASALFVEPDILMLDEPTNHLDLEACVWLERYLQNYKKTLMLVSHDRLFTNNVITDVILFRNKKLHYFSGNVDTYEQTRSRQDLEQSRAHEAQKLKREHIQQFVDKFRASAARAALVQSRIKMLNKMDLIDEVIDDSEFKFIFPDPSDSLSTPILQVQDVSFGYPRRREDNETEVDAAELGPPKPLFQDVNFGVDLGSRIAILGPNGAGKTTLMQVVLGTLEPQNGYVLRNSRLRIAHFAQHHVDQVDMNASPLEYMLSRFPGTKPDDIRSHLSQYGITADLAQQVIKTLSGGQKSRVSFAEITFRKPHILVLDEATNHLDLQTVEALILAVKNFQGGVLFVSHDQHFISQCAKEFWTIKDGAVKQFQGNFSEYKKWAVPAPEK